MPPESRTHRRRRRADRQRAAGGRGALPARRRCAHCLPRGDCPARNPDRNLVRSARAACGLHPRRANCCASPRRARVARWSPPIWTTSSPMPRKACGGCSAGCRMAAFAYEMDNGAVVQVAIRIDRDSRSAVFDFTGTSAQLPDNFNAPRVDHPRGCALCAAHADRRCDPDE